MDDEFETVTMGEAMRDLGSRIMGIRVRTSDLGEMNDMPRGMHEVMCTRKHRNGWGRQRCIRRFRVFTMLIMTATIGAAYRPDHG